MKERSDAENLALYAGTLVAYVEWPPQVSDLVLLPGNVNIRPVGSFNSSPLIVVGSQYFPSPINMASPHPASLPNIYYHCGVEVDSISKSIQNISTSHKSKFERVRLKGRSWKYVGFSRYRNSVKLNRYPDKSILYRYAVIRNLSFRIKIPPDVRDVWALKKIVDTNQIQHTKTTRPSRIACSIRRQICACCSLPTGMSHVTP